MKAVKCTEYRKDVGLVSGLVVIAVEEVRRRRNG